MTNRQRGDKSVSTVVGFGSCGVFSSKLFVFVRRFSFRFCAAHSSIPGACLYDRLGSERAALLEEIGGSHC